MAETASAYVLDSCAMLAYFQAEPGGLSVRELLEASYADAFAAALAQEFGATLVTGDPEFRAVESRIAVMWLPNK